MLDKDVPRIRIDRLREYIEEQKSNCEKQMVRALEAENRCGHSLESGKVEAYNDILFVLEQRAQEYEDYKENSSRNDITDKC